MDPMDLLNSLIQFNLFQLYIPIVASVGFSHPLTFTIIAAHNVLSMTYLLFLAAVAYPLLREKTWLLPVAVTLVWAMSSVHVAATLPFSTEAAITMTLPHGWLEFLGMAYWINAMRKASREDNLGEINSPTFKDYSQSWTNPRRIAMLVRTDVKVSYKTTRLSLKMLWSNLRKPYAITIALIAVAALIETFITPRVMFLFNAL